MHQRHDGDDTPGAAVTMTLIGGAGDDKLNGVTASIARPVASAWTV
jgi:hypothetical protein